MGISKPKEGKMSYSASDLTDKIHELTQYMNKLINEQRELQEREEWLKDEINRTIGAITVLQEFTLEK